MVHFRTIARACTFAAWLAAGMGAGIAQVADRSYPTRPVRMVVGFTPGGTTDALGRLMATKLGAAMGQPWVVENRGGAAGNSGTAAVVGAAPDGYTVLFALDTQLTANPSLYKLAFDVQTALQPVTMLAKFENVLTVSPSVAAQNLQDVGADRKLSHWGCGRKLGRVMW
jgi:tripartite-type tricarboxylate transporter receptor subunit TctC